MARHLHSFMRRQHSGVNSFVKAWDTNLGGPMIRFSDDGPSAANKGVRLLCAGLLAALFLLPATALADSNTTYDVTGTFSNGVTITSGSSFTLETSGSTTQLFDATIDTSAGDFSCTTSSPHTSTCSFYTLTNGIDYINVPDGSGYISLRWLASNLTGFPPTLPLNLSSYIYSNGPPATASYLTAGSGSLATPEPGTFLLMLSGIGGLFFLNWRRVQA